MINSIQHFIEKKTYEIEKTMREFVEGTLDIDSYGKDLQERSLNLARNILVETLLDYKAQGRKGRSQGLRSSS
ncbi:hypothetical protein [Clostridium sp. Marseille-P2415]|uniref:hypothetical protein n=1 Tax=Clostridium sp. Marseille-P2415 TaxID=1805471 RepID=UPI0009885763|nr:hypothetical protein [Clostridium sp. Marseille-P2415]